MRILLLGATGRTGKWVLKYALDKDIVVNCLARKIERITSHENVKIFEGDPTDQEDLERAMNGCDSVISVLNISRTSDFPWAKIRTPKTFLSDTMKLLIPLAERNSIKRLIVCSAWGVAETRQDLPGWFRWIIDYSNIGIAYADHEYQEKLIENCGLDWTIVRPTGLTNSSNEDSVKESINNEPKPSLFISRKALGKHLINCLNRDNLINQKVVISKK